MKVRINSAAFFLSAVFAGDLLIDIVELMRRDAWAAGLLDDDFLLQRVSWIKSGCLCFRVWMISRFKFSVLIGAS